MQLIGSALLVCAFMGYAAWVVRVRRLHPSWAPGLVLAGWSVWLMGGGFLDLLPVAAALLVVGGLAFAVYELMRHRTALRRNLLSPAVGVLAAVSVATALGLSQAAMTHYDNFSHWALVVQVMLQQDGFPAAADELVLFTTYPLGAASVSYLAGRVVGPSDLPMLTLHNLWIAAGALPLLATAARVWRWAAAATVIAMVFLMTYITPPNSLLVDPRIGSQVAWAALFLFLHRHRMAARLPELALVLTSMVAIKTSGALFALLIILVALALSWRQKPHGAKVWLLAPVLMLAAWQSHVTRTFPDAGQAKHSVSVSRYAAILDGKTPEQLTEIAKSLTVAVGTDWFLWLTLALLTIALTGLVRRHVLSRKGALLTAGLVLATTAVWVAALLGTYFFSMPTEEAMRLAGFDRYMQTWHLAIVVLTAGLLLMLLPTWERSGARRWIATIGTVLPLTLTLSAVSEYTRPTVLGIPAEDYRAYLEQGLDELEVTPQDTLCVAVPGQDRGFTRHLTRYLSLHPEVRSGPISEASTPEWVPTCTRALIITEQPEAQRILKGQGIPTVEVP